jgi:hypothetical protein
MEVSPTKERKSVSQWDSLTGDPSLLSEVSFLPDQLPADKVL